ncbi:MAG: hypothetical protein ABI627_13900 [Polyangiaceae bacterium]
MQSLHCGIELELLEGLFLELPRALGREPKEGRDLRERMRSLIGHVDGAVARRVRRVLPGSTVGQVVPAFGVRAARVRRTVINALREGGVTRELVLAAH